MIINMKDGVAEEGEGMTRLVYYCFESKGFHLRQIIAERRRFPQQA